MMRSIDDVRAAITSAPMSTVLIGVNLAVFAAVTVNSGLLDVLALPPDFAGVAAAPWTVLTVFFTAEAPIHIAGAVLIIALFGVRFEGYAGSGHVLGVYMLAGLAGSLSLVATAVATGFDEASVGASAAFLGLVGALAACPRRTWGAKLPVDKLIVVLAIIQLTPVVGFGDWVSSVAHLVGLAVGGAYGYTVRARIGSQPATPVRG